MECIAIFYIFIAGEITRVEHPADCKACLDMQIDFIYTKSIGGEKFSPLIKSMRCEVRDNV